jgi:hypothetical protein
LVSPCTGNKRPKRKFFKEDGAETTALLAGDEYLECDLEFDSVGEPSPMKTTAAAQPHSAPKKPVKRPSWSQIFTPQSKAVLLAYSLLALHSMAFDTLLPVFLHHPIQDLDEPHVKLPFKFAGGFGIGESP